MPEDTRVGADGESLASLLEKEALLSAARRGQSKPRRTSDEHAPAVDRVGELERALEAAEHNVRRLEQELEQAQQVPAQQPGLLQQAHHKVTQLQQQLEQAARRLSQTQQELEQVNQRAVRLEGELVKAHQRSEHLDKEHERTLAQESRRAADFEAELATARRRVQALEEQLGDSVEVAASDPTPDQQLTAELEHKNDRIKELEEQLRLTVHQVYDLEARLDESGSSDPQLERLAYQDSLTGLPNGNLSARYLQHSLSAAVERGSAVSLVLIDFDHFKKVNDRFGPEAGDRLIQRSAAALRQAFPPETVVARRGEDEFLVVVDHEATQEVARLNRVCHQIRQVLAGSHELDGQHLPLTISMGVSTAPQPAATVDELIQQAEAALYRAKELGRNRVQLFNQAMLEHVEQQRLMQTRFYDACVAGQIGFRFSPVVDLETRTILGAEVEPQWHFETVLAGTELFELIGKCGLGDYLGSEVLNRACQAAAALGPSGRAFVRLLPGQLLHKDFPGRCMKAVESAAIKPTQLFIEPRLEDYESQPTTYGDALDAVLRWGIGLIYNDVNHFIDSRERWFRIPHCYLRLPAELVSQTPDGDPGSTLCVGTVRLATADASKVSTLAEGVSNIEQAQFLRMVGCTVARGPLFEDVFRLEDLVAGQQWQF